MATAWTTDKLYEPFDAAADPPTTEQLRAMLDELHNEWVPDEFDAFNLHLWACDRFGTSMDEMTPERLNDRCLRRVNQYKTLFQLIRRNDELIECGEVKDKLSRIAKVIREARNSLTSAAILFFQIDTRRRLTMPERWSPESYFQHIEEDEKANSFQKVLVHILRQMSVDELRKIDDWTYKEIVIKGTKERSHAWRPFMSIRDYIYKNVTKETFYAEWKNLTNPHDNGERVVQHLVRCNEVELPAIQMNRFLWSYENGLYNVRDDTFWPFRSIVIRSLAACHPAAVAMLPVYQHTTEEESQLDATDHVRLANGVVAYNLTDGYLTVDSLLFCPTTSTYRSNFLGRQVWPQLADDITAFRRGTLILTLSDVSAERVTTLCPVTTPPSTPDENKCLLKDGVRVWSCGEKGALTKHTVFQLLGHDDYRSNDNGHTVWSPNIPGEKMYRAEVPTMEDVSVKYFDQPFRFEITPEAEAEFNAEEIELPELKRIMEVQDLTDDTQKWMLVMLCRLFFPVGFDRWQVAPFIKGIAGSGKSTIAQIIRSFYPPHKVTTLASNIETKFGLSAIYKGLVCICAEVREDFGLDQADWQSAVTGEEVQIAIKGKTAIPHKWDTPLFLLGNEVMKYRNASGSVERRIFMFEFRKRVINSDPKLFDKLLKNIDRFQRKGVVLYHEMLRKWGEKDIWAPGVVGRQLTLFKQNMKKQTDILVAFIADAGVVELATNSYMPLKLFMEKYKEYRQANGHDRVRITPDHYESQFQDLGITCEISTKIWENKKTTAHFLCGVGLSADIEED